VAARIGEVAHVARRVRHETDLQTRVPQLVEHGHDVLVELEVLVALPPARELHGHDVRHRLRAPHADDDPLGERDPDLFVVLELRVPRQIDERSVSCVLVPRRLE